MSDVAAVALLTLGKILTVTLNWPLITMLNRHWTPTPTSCT